MDGWRGLILPNNLKKGEKADWIIERKWASIYDVRSGGSPKSRQKEQNQLISMCDWGGEGIKKSENFADVIYGRKPPKAASVGRGLR